MRRATTELEHYVLGDLLGRGPLAEVFGGYAVGDHGFEKPVVIKRLLPDVVRDRAFVPRLIGEAKRQVGTHHGNLVSVLDLVCDHDDIFVVVEFVDGPSLRELIASRRLSPGLAAYIVLSVAAGLEAARVRHGSAGMHADLSPRNILLSKSGEVRIGDLGLLRKTGTCYSAPGTHCDGEACDAAALGVLLDQLTGARLSQHVMPPHGRVREVIDAIVELQYTMEWRDGAAELARVIRELTPSRGVAATLVTGKPVTLITRSLIDELPTVRRSPALSITSDVTIARAPRGGRLRRPAIDYALTVARALRGRLRRPALQFALADRHALAVFAMAALFGTLAAIVV